MHARPTLPQPVAVTAPPLPAATSCPHCGLLPTGATHREDCFPAFQVELLRAHPALQDVISLPDADAIERIFWSWADMIRVLTPRSHSLADGCVERRWEEASGYVERLLARHARHHTATDAAMAAAS